VTRRRQQASVNTAVAYVRVSTDEQVLSGAGLQAQRECIVTEAQRRGLQIVEWHADEGLSGTKDIHARPGLAASIAAVEQGIAKAILVAKSDRVARSLRTLLNVVDRVERAGGAIVAVDGTIDTSSAAGRFQTQVMGGVAELERALISDRTKAALAVKRAQGVRLGRPSALPREVVARIVKSREGGATLRAVAEELTADNVPTARGGTKWSTSTIQGVLGSQDAERVRAELISA
jgi:DNA invertase Pin-like site-specific DNA recombinase